MVMPTTPVGSTRSRSRVRAPTTSGIAVHGTRGVHVGDLRPASNRVGVTQGQGRPRLVDLPEAASLLRLSEDGVEALVGAGYLRPTPDDKGSPRFAVGDLKAFVARNADEGAGTLFGPGADDLDPN